MSEESTTNNKFNFQRISLLIILINCLILIPLISVILANIGGNAVYITTIVFFGILIANSFMVIIFDLIRLLQNRKNRVKKDV
jgi:hypothetical protein